MINAWLRGLAKVKWLVLVLWIAAAVGSVFVFPDLKQIVRETEWRFLPQDAASAKAAQILNEMSPDRKSKSNAVIVLNREGGLTENDQTWIKGKIDELKRDKDALGISGVLSQFEDPSVAEKFVSEDKSTEIILVELPKDVNAGATGDSVNLLKDRMRGAPEGTTVDFTGSAPIFLDYSHSSEEGLRKSEVLTLVLVMVILLIVFRSPVAPLVPLLTIGISFVITRGLVAAFTAFGLPVSTFTETFLIATMFGAGTDYCILLISRYREELSKTPDRVEALVQTVKSVGKTIIFAGSTVFIAFFLIGFAKFGLYQSAAGVAIGIAVTLLAATTLAPVLMLILGNAMYWPMKVKAGAAHGESKWWGGMNKLAAKRPVVILLACLLVMTPITLLFQGSRSFDDLGEMDKNTSAVKGFRTVEEKFSSGEVLPITAVISAGTSMRTPEALAAIEKASADAAKVANVKEVRSAARPLGKQIAELTVPSQLEQTNKALTDVKSGVSQIGDGLRQAQSELTGKSGDIDKLKSGAATIADKLKEAEFGLNRISGGLNDSKRGSEQLAGAANQLEQTAQSISADLGELAKQHPELAQDPVYLGLMAKSQGVTGGLAQTKTGLQDLHQGIAQMAPAAGQLTAGIGQLAVGQTQIASGVEDLQQGLQQFASGLGDGTSALSQASDGLSQIVNAQQGIAQDGSRQIAGWYMPRNMFDDNEQLQKALDAYMSPDGKIAKMDIVLAINPYSDEAMKTVGELEAAIKMSLKGTPMEKAEIGMAGTSAQYDELKDISANDFYRTGGLMLAGIFIVLALLLRSLIMPIYLLLSLVFNYLVTMGILEFIFVRVLGYPGLSWTVSFFLFLILVALGVDYNIFLMSRFKEEYEPGGVLAALRKAMRTTGGVIISAAVIMAGTFAALMPSGVTTLLQLGAGIVIGLVIYSTVMMGLFIPSITVLFGEANWWPFRSRTDKDNPQSAGSVREEAI